MNIKRTKGLLLLILLVLIIGTMTGCNLLDFIFDFLDDDSSHTPGARFSYTVAGITFYMRGASGVTFPVGDNRAATVTDDFLIAETQVTYELWYAVRTWAENNGYTFSNSGGEGSHGTIADEPTARKREPVTRINWYDALVWCNALSDRLGRIPVYRYLGTVIKDATDHVAGNNASAENWNGFRLPTCDEWELAARYKGNDSSFGAREYPVGSGIYWTPWEYASGAMNSYTDSTANTQVAWYAENSGGQTQEVAGKSRNSLGLYDMSGNVFEWCFEWYPTYYGTHKVNRGGSWSYGAGDLRTGSVNCARADAVSPSHGFRIVTSEP